MDNEKFMKLPRWAKDEINRLERNSQDAEEQIRQMNSGEESLVYWNDGLAREKHGLPDRATVTFQTPNGPISVMIRDGELSVMSMAINLLVRPSAANSIRILAENR